MVVNNTSTVMCLKEVHLYSISTIKSIELSVKLKMFASFCNGLLESKYEGRNPQLKQCPLMISIPGP